MAANLYRRGDTWWWKAMIHGKVYRKTTGMTDLQMAKRKASEFDKAIRAGDAGWAPMAPTVAEWIERYLGRLEGYALEINTARLRTAREVWGNRRMDSIKRSDCDDYIAARLREGKLKPGTIWLECIRLKHLFNLALHDEIIAKNPWMRVTLPKPPKRSRVISAEEEAKIREVLDPDGWIARLITVALGTGLRRGELMGLRPRDIIDGVIHVPKELAKGGKARTVPLRPAVRTALRAQVPWEVEVEATGAWRVVEALLDERFFPYSTGHVSLRISEVSEKAGIPRFTLHDLRRTFATRAATGELTGRSMPLLHLTRIMGHSDPQVTASYYVYLNDAELIRQMKSQETAELDTASLKRDMGVEE